MGFEVLLDGAEVGRGGVALGAGIVGAASLADADLRLFGEAAWGAAGSAVAVRSSAPGEDSRKVSFAGLHESHLGVVGPAVAAAIAPRERVRDVVLTAAWGSTGHWREEYATVDLERADALLDWLGAGALRDRAFGTLSDGERKRGCSSKALTPGAAAGGKQSRQRGADQGGAHLLPPADASCERCARARSAIAERG